MNLKSIQACLYNLIKFWTLSINFEQLLHFGVFLALKMWAFIIWKQVLLYGIFVLIYLLLQGKRKLNWVVSLVRTKVLFNLWQPVPISLWHVLIFVLVYQNHLWLRCNKLSFDNPFLQIIFKNSFFDVFEHGAVVKNALNFFEPVQLQIKLFVAVPRWANFSQSQLFHLLFNFLLKYRYRVFIFL